jgi:hypothetical protein
MKESCININMASTTRPEEGQREKHEYSVDPYQERMQKAPTPDQRAQGLPAEKEPNNPYQSVLEEIIGKEADESRDLLGIAAGIAIGALFAAGINQVYNLLRTDEDSPLYRKKAKDALDYAKMEVRVEDIDNTRVNRTILRYDGKDYLFVLGKDGAPEARPYAIHIDTAKPSAKTSDAKTSDSETQEKPGQQGNGSGR